MLSLATFASTWCGYQAQQWGGAQGDLHAAADTAERQAAENTIVALQLRTQDSMVLSEYWQALRHREPRAAQTILLHMRPVLRQALQASVDSGILHDPSLAGPLQRPEYILTEEQRAAEQRAEAGKLKADATSAGKFAGQYVVLTLMFASVLFFGGIAGTFNERRVRAGLAIVSLCLFAFTLLSMVGLPASGG